MQYPLGRNYPHAKNYHFWGCVPIVLLHCVKRYLPLGRSNVVDDPEEAISGKVMGMKTMPFSHGRIPVNAILVAEQAHADRKGFDRVKVGLKGLRAFWLLLCVEPNTPCLPPYLIYVKNQWFACLSCHRRCLSVERWPSQGKTCIGRRYRTHVLLLDVVLDECDIGISSGHCTRHHWWLE